MKEIFRKYWEHEKARYMKHPYFWTIVTVGLVVWLLNEYRVVKRLEIEKFPEDLLDEVE